MYKASKKSEVVQKLESEENSKRVEIYNNLRSQAVELRGQVDKVCCQSIFVEPPQWCTLNLVDGQIACEYSLGSS